MNTAVADFRCIAIETSTAMGSVAVANGEQMFVVKLPEKQNSSRQIYQAVAEALNRADLTRQDLTCVAVGNGPGSFTGLRVATAAAQALSYSLQLPVCVVSSLAAIAAEAGRVHGVEPVAACLDARMGEAYVGIYEFAADGLTRAVQADGLVDPREFRLPDAGRPAMAAGPGWEAYPDMLHASQTRIGASDTSIWPGAAAIALEASELFRQGRYSKPQDVLPNYVRNKVTY